MHVMLDLETLGTDSDAVIIQIGAVLFEPVSGGKVLNNKGLNIFVNPDQNYGSITASTLTWWMKQPTATMMAYKIEEEGVDLPLALYAFKQWPTVTKGIGWDNIGGIWSNGATFDQSILAHAFKILGQPAPWGYRTSRDCRTLFDLVGGPPKIDWTGLTPHDALDDAVGQAMQVQKAMQLLRG